jgi:two-component system, cell cycle sensor histidine kinase and response regulator CckA
LTDNIGILIKKYNYFSPFEKNKRIYSGKIFISANNLRAKKKILYYNNRKSSKFIKISIKVNGNCILKNNYNRVFDPFFTTNFPIKSGLGLPIAISILRMHNGYIEFNSKIGAGNIFNIYLPAL